MLAAFLSPVVSFLILVATTVGAAWSTWQWYLLYRNEKAQKKAEQDMQFYQECKSFGIVNWSDTAAPDKRQRVELLAKKHKVPYSKTEDIASAFERSRATYEAVVQEREDQALKDLKAKERERIQQLTFYAGLHGLEKPLTMMADKASAYRAEANGTSFLPTRKESDGAILAGLSYGMGGPIPALMSLSSTAQSNANIRAHNEAVNNFNRIIFEGQMASLKLAKSWEEDRDKTSTKLISDLPKEKVFQSLTFSNTQVNVSDSGTVTVTTQVVADPKLTIFENTPALVDGSVIAEIYDSKHTKIGEAVLVFPVYGSDTVYWDKKVDHLPLTSSAGRKRAKDLASSQTPLEGMCLFCGQPGKKYTVKFVPGDLWAMER